MSADTTSFSEVELDQAPWPILVPSQRVEDADWLAGAKTLLLAALSRYNASLQALNRKKIPRAIELVEQALQVMPYCPKLLEYGVALAIQHGDFVLASRILHMATALGLYDLSHTYSEELTQRVAQWNEAIAYPKSLSARYAANDGVPSYRDLLYLQSLSLAPQSQRLQHDFADYGLLAYKDSVERTLRWPLYFASVFVAVVLGGVAGFFFFREDATRPVAQATDVATIDSSHQQIGEEFYTILEMLANDDASNALTEMQSMSHKVEVSSQAIDALEQVAIATLVDEAAPLWKRKDYAGLLRKLRPSVQVDSMAHPEILYYLGIAAENGGEYDLAFEAFARFLDHEDAAEYPHFRAQAAYSAALLAPQGEAQSFAQIIATDYPSTLYYNSKIRSLLHYE